jgi:hypothetical protein
VRELVLQAEKDAPEVRRDDLIPDVLGVGFGGTPDAVHPRVVEREAQRAVVLDRTRDERLDLC